MPDPTSKAIFISHASQDNLAAQRICDGLRSKGIEVWFDSDGGLEHGDEWDAKIRRQIKECVLFIPLISAATQARHEGYFRIEWDLAAERARGFASGVPFILPILIDETREPDALVPDRFRSVQWTKLPEGLVTPEFLSRFLKVWSHRTGVLSQQSAPITSSPVPAAGAGVTQVQRRTAPWLIVIAILVGAVGAPAVWFLAAHRSTPVPESKLAAAVEAAPPTAPVAPNSAAVLAFENLSEDKANEYFSDGISDELLSVLTKVPGLHVAARTSSFYFKGKSATAQEIGEKLRVANLVEGSVRRSGNSVRIAARLSRVASGEELWSENYTRSLNDVFAVQSELAQTIVAQLRQQLGAPVAPKEIVAEIKAAERGGTTNADAHQLFLQGQFCLRLATLDNLHRAKDLLTRAVALDPHYTLAWVALSYCGSLLNGFGTTQAEVEEGMKLGREGADRALSEDPELVSSQLANASVEWDEYNWAGAAASLARARQLDPDNSDVLYSVGFMQMTFGRPAAATELFRRAIAVDPVDPLLRTYLGFSLLGLNRFAEAEEQFRQILAISPDYPFGYGGLAVVSLYQGKYEAGLSFGQQSKTAWIRLTYSAMAQWSLEQHAASEQSLQALIAQFHEVAAYQIAEVYAYRGNFDDAFSWLETAYRQHDPGLVKILMDRSFQGLKDDPRWHAFLKRVGLAPEQIADLGR